MTEHGKRGRVFIAEGSDGRRHRITEWVHRHGFGGRRTSLRTADGKSVSLLTKRQYQIAGTDIIVAF